MKATITLDVDAKRKCNPSRENCGVVWNKFEGVRCSKSGSIPSMTTSSRQKPDYKHFLFVI